MAATGLVLALTLMMASVALAATDANYRDEFKQVGFSGSDGSRAWSGSWSDGEPSNMADFGYVLVAGHQRCASGPCLNINAPFGSGPPHTVAARRGADLSVFDQADLSFDRGGSGFGAATLRVQVTGDGCQGGGWQTLDTWQITNSGPMSQKLSLSGYLSSTFCLRFSVEGTPGVTALIDNVDITGTLKPPPTTTTKPTTTSTTKPSTSDTKPSTTNDTRPAVTVVTKPTTPDTKPDDTRPTDTRPDDSTTTTSVPESTTTTEVGGPTTTRPNRLFPIVEASDFHQASSGLRHTNAGVQANFQVALYGQPEMVIPEVLGLSADYRMAVEAIEANWIWLLALTLIIAAATLNGSGRFGPGPTN